MKNLKFLSLGAMVLAGGLFLVGCGDSVKSIEYYETHTKERAEKQIWCLDKIGIEAKIKVKDGIYQTEKAYTLTAFDYDMNKYKKELNRVNQLLKDELNDTDYNDCYNALYTGSDSFMGKAPRL